MTRSVTLLSRLPPQMPISDELAERLAAGIDAFRAAIGYAKDRRCKRCGERLQLGTKERLERFELRVFCSQHCSSRSNPPIPS